MQKFSDRVISGEQDELSRRTEKRLNPRPENLSRE